MGRSSPRTAMTICHVLQALLPMELTIDASPPQIRVGSTGSGTTMSLPDMGPFDLRHTASQVAFRERPSVHSQVDPLLLQIQMCCVFSFIQLASEYVHLS